MIPRGELMFKGGHELYRLTESSETTTLDIKSDIPVEYFDDMEPKWDEALVKLKLIAENK